MKVKTDLLIKSLTDLLKAEIDYAADQIVDSLQAAVRKTAKAAIDSARVETMVDEFDNTFAVKFVFDIERHSLRAEVIDDQMIYSGPEERVERHIDTV